ncbi:DNA cytosine methyltransferase [Photobacterium lutimaris]|uniref:DNA (cytosine-5-)-methyltransferase n=1 Tax=Photobacterium lutimaris TaxID=388278 RepID=A0A2T3ITY9_9GAMM|nr:DNA cytosine methyltransferase [Photobacterium lutimaris]PSU31839.1 DNA (cytosine-5-)-methyltransferase [Photobacterium lutimaris]TDR73361.1 DNA (cytosine-5)-methyltransferase 1 [Photobacterium lutimaris]
MSAIDLFAGAGGFSLAAHLEGLDVLAAIELDASASNTYRANIIERLGQETRLLNGDILQISPQDLRTELGLAPGELQIMLGGPPCQGFSSHRINDAGVDDPRNKLLLRYYDFVEEFQPQAFLVENVAGLFWERHAPYLEAFQQLAEDNGYVIHFCDTLNGKDYGTPQNRKRAFILGVRNDINRENLVFPPAQSHFSPSSVNVVRDGLPAWRTASAVFEPLTEELIERYIREYFRVKTGYTDEQALEILHGLEFGEPVLPGDPCNIHMIPTERMQQQFIATPLNGGRTDTGPEFEKKCHANGYPGHKDVYGRVFIHLPSNTMTTGCNNPSKGRFVHPWENHGFTLRHAARLQTFPDDYIFTGSTTDQAKQIGNAVPTVLGHALISAIINGLN